MARPLRVLIVEDSSDDAELMLLELRRAGFDPSWQRVDTPEALRTALAQGAWEIVFWDYTLPGLDALAALAMLKQASADLPFIVVSGTLGEEQAVRLMKAGADDYLLKGNLARLASAVERTLRDAADRRARREAESERNRLLAQLRLQIERLPLAYILFDAHNRVLDWNPAAQRMFGYTREEMVGQGALGMLVPLPKNELVQDVIRRIRAGDMDAHSVNENRTKDGRLITCEWFNTPLMDPAGRFTGAISLAQDTTERQRAEEVLRASEERFRGTFENAAVGIAHLDADCRYLRVNQTLCDILGYSRDELMGMTCRQLTHPDDLAAGSERFLPLMRGEAQRFSAEKRYLHKNGSLVWVDRCVALQRDPEGKPAYAIEVIQDISERKRLEGELRQAKETAEAANRAKDEFLANVSHELRTPLSAILGMTELVLDSPLTEAQRDCMQTVKSAADNLLGIINDLLDFSKIQAGKLQLAPADFSLQETLEDTLRSLATRARTKGLELGWQVQPGVPDALVGDDGRLRQVLLNLVDNAIKFTAQGEVAIAVGNERKRPARTDNARCTLRFTVRDTGIGIPSHKQKAIFQPFEQEDTSTTRKYGGTGLGLTIAARLVALMEGTIQVASELGRGSTFTFTAQFGRQPHPLRQVGTRPLTRQLAEAAVRPLRILVAEDNEFNTRHLEQLLSRQGHRVRLVNNGREALALLGIRGQRSGVRGQQSEADSSLTAVRCPLTAAFDLLLLDLHMPELDGFQVAQAIRKWERRTGGHLPVIALTARSRSEDRERCLAAGMDDYLAKPVRTAELFTAIDRLVAAHGVSRPSLPVAVDQTSLLDPIVLLAVCGGDAAGLRGLCQDFQTYAPARLAEVGDALRDEDLPWLREAAHKLSGLLAAFSTVAGNLAADLEDEAARGQLGKARTLLRRLEPMVHELLRQVDASSLESLQRQAGTAPPYRR